MTMQSKDPYLRETADANVRRELTNP